MKKQERLFSRKHSIKKENEKVRQTHLVKLAAGVERKRALSGCYSRTDKKKVLNKNTNKSCLQCSFSFLFFFSPFQKKKKTFD